MTTYATQETSVAGSEPVELYKFERDDGAGTTESWFYANCESDVLFQGNLYEATPGIHRSNIQQSGEDVSMQLTVDLPRTACLTDELKGTLSPSPISITVYRGQRGLADTEAAMIYNGEIAGPLFSGSMCTLTCTSEEAAWSDSLVRTTCQRTCPFMLYDTLCGADPFLTTWGLKIAAVSADFLTITVNETTGPVPAVDHLTAGNLYYQAGYVTLLGSNYFVAQQNGHDLILQTPMPGAAIGVELTGTMGCDRTTSAATGCVGHNNIARHGGFNLIPVVNPWAGLT